MTLLQTSNIDKKLVERYEYNYEELIVITLKTPPDALPSAVSKLSWNAPDNMTLNASMMQVVDKWCQEINVVSAVDKCGS
jgi:hypothetical protein